MTGWLDRTRLAVLVIVVLLLAGLVTIVVLTLMGPDIGTVYQTCTLMLGMDYTEVKLNGDVPASYSLELDVDATTLALTCPSNEQAGTMGSSGISMRCFSDEVQIFHLDNTPDEMTITVQWEGGTKTETFHPIYETWYPNGEGCEPERQRAIVTLQLP